MSNLEELASLVQKQRRLLAGQLRITREEKEIRERIAALLVSAGVEQTVCTVEIGGVEKQFAVFRVDRDGRQYAVVNEKK
jgi:hypothetical protein